MAYHTTFSAYHTTPKKIKENSNTSIIPVNFEHCPPRARPRWLGPRRSRFVFARSADRGPYIDGTYMKIQRPLGRSGGLDERAGRLIIFGAFSSSAQSSSARVTHTHYHSRAFGAWPAGGAALSLGRPVLPTHGRATLMLSCSTLRSIA